jgi:hypothetical protein
MSPPGAESGTAGKESITKSLQAPRSIEPFGARANAHQQMRTHPCEKPYQRAISACLKINVGKLFPLYKYHARLIF